MDILHNGQPLFKGHHTSPNYRVYVKPGPWTGLDHGLDWTGLDCDIETRNSIRVFTFFPFHSFFHVE